MDSSISLLPNLDEVTDVENDQTCQENGDCNDRSPLCSPMTLTCVECISDGDCGGTEPQRCLAGEGECVQCLSDADCTSTTEPYCDPDSNFCEECLLDEHCAGGEICDADDERCIELR